MIFRAVVLLLLLLAAPFSVSAQSAEAGSSAPPAVLNPGDAVRIVVWRQPELSGEFLISERGTVSHPLFRDVQVAGLSTAEVEERVGSYLSRLEANPQFVVEPLLRVTVGGEVRQPSLYRLSPGTTVAEAVAQAGGISERANLQNVRLFRDGRQYTVNLSSPEAGMAHSPIRSGDQLFVTRRSDWLRDYVGPAASVTAAVAAIARLFIR